MEAAMDENKARFLVAAYEAHKNELMQRRRSDIIGGGLALLFYIVSLRMVQQRPPATVVLSGLTMKLAGTIIYVIITDVAAYFLVKNYHRMCELQHLIARIDVAFGFFEKDAYLPGEKLYPEEWKSSGTISHWSAVLRALIPIIFGVAVIALFWLRQI
jgi:hypothetical protein